MHHESQDKRSAPSQLHLRNAFDIHYQPFIRFLLWCTSELPSWFVLNNACLIGLATVLLLSTTDDMCPRLRSVISLPKCVRSNNVAQVSQAWYSTPLIPSLRRYSQLDLCKFKASLIYKVSSRTATKRTTVWEQNGLTWPQNSLCKCNLELLIINLWNIGMHHVVQFRWYLECVLGSPTGVKHQKQLGKERIYLYFNITVPHQRW